MGYYDGTYKRYGHDGADLVFEKRKTYTFVSYRVVLCCDHIRSKKDLEDTLVHELTHAFDSLRKGKFKSICHLIACGEIRASALGKLN